MVCFAKLAGSRNSSKHKISSTESNQKILVDMIPPLMVAESRSP